MFSVKSFDKMTKNGEKQLKGRIDRLYEAFCRGDVEACVERSDVS